MNKLRVKRIVKEKPIVTGSLKLLVDHILSHMKNYDREYLMNYTPEKLLNLAHPRYRDYHASLLLDEGIITKELANQYLS